MHDVLDAKRQTNRQKPLSPERQDICQQTSNIGIPTRSFFSCTAIGSETACAGLTKPRASQTVNIYTSSTLPKASFYDAFAQGNNIVMLKQSDELFAHELGHVFQQAGKNIPATDDFQGYPVLHDSVLEQGTKTYESRAAKQANLVFCSGTYTPNQHEPIQFGPGERFDTFYGYATESMNQGPHVIANSYIDRLVDYQGNLVACNDKTFYQLLYDRLIGISNILELFLEFYYQQYAPLQEKVSEKRDSKMRIGFAAACDTCNEIMSEFYKMCYCLDLLFNKDVVHFTNNIVIKTSLEIIKNKAASSGEITPISADDLSSLLSYIKQSAKIFITSSDRPGPGHGAFLQILDSLCRTLSHLCKQMINLSPLATYAWTRNATPDELSGKSENASFSNLENIRSLEDILKYNLLDYYSIPFFLQELQQEDAVNLVDYFCSYLCALFPYLKEGEDENILQFLSTINRLNNQVQAGYSTVEPLREIALSEAFACFTEAFYPHFKHIRRKASSGRPDTFYGIVSDLLDMRGAAYLQIILQETSFDAFSQFYAYRSAAPNGPHTVAYCYLKDIAVNQVLKQMAIHNQDGYNNDMAKSKIIEICQPCLFEAALESLFTINTGSQQFDEFKSWYIKLKLEEYRYLYCGNWSKAVILELLNLHPFATYSWAYGARNDDLAGKGESSKGDFTNLPGILESSVIDLSSLVYIPNDQWTNFCLYIAALFPNCRIEGTDSQNGRDRANILPEFLCNEREFLLAHPTEARNQYIEPYLLYLKNIIANNAGMCAVMLPPLLQLLGLSSLCRIDTAKVFQALSLPEQVKADSAPLPESTAEEMPLQQDVDERDIKNDDTHLYDDTEMEQIICSTLITEDITSINVKVVPPSIFNGASFFDTTHLHSFAFPLLKHQDLIHLLIPCNVNNNHWTGIYLQIQKTKASVSASFIDTANTSSEEETSSGTEQYKERIYTSLFKFSLELFGDKNNFFWTEITCPVQQDATSCGPLVCNFLSYIMCRVHKTGVLATGIEFDVSADNIRNLRNIQADLKRAFLELKLRTSEGKMQNLLEIGKIVQQNPEAVVIYKSLRQYVKAYMKSIVDAILKQLDTCGDEEEKLAFQNILDDIAGKQQQAETMDMDCQQLIGQFC